MNLTCIAIWVQEILLPHGQMDRWTSDTNTPLAELGQGVTTNAKHTKQDITLTWWKYQT